MVRRAISAYVIVSLLVWFYAVAKGFGFWAWYDAWCGVFCDRKKRTWYVCPLPCVVIKISPKAVGDDS